MTADSRGKPSSVRRYLVGLGVASIVVLAFLLYSLGAFATPASTSTAAATTSTSFSVDASSVVAAAGAHAPDGYAQGSSRQLNPSESGLESGGYGTFSAQSGSIANMTILVFDAPESARTYIYSIINNSKGLSGYSDISGSLASYLRYGVCYGFGQTDPDGNGAVATGVCTKGNVYIQVHVVSPSSLSSAQGDMSDLMGAAYQGIG